MTASRLLQRLFFYPTKFIISLSEYVNTDFYRNSYAWFLKKFGMTLNGRPLYIHNTVKFDDFNRITLSKDVVISFGVYILTHDYSRRVAYNTINEVNNIQNKKIDNKKDNPLIRDVIIENNVFIGCRSLILPGTIIGKNSIIGAGSVIRGTIPEGSVVIGNPAKIIGNVLEIGEKWRNS